MTSRVVIGSVPLRGVTVPASMLPGILTASPAPGGRTLALEALQREARTVTSDAAGDATVEFGPADQGHLWLLESMLIRVVDAAPGSAASVYIGSVSPAAIVAGTTHGDLDTADGDPPIYVPGGSSIFVVWSGAGVGNVCLASAQYRIMRLVG